MKKELAQRASELLTQIDSTIKKRENFINTKEFCEIRITGEDGTEREYNFTLSYKHNKEEIQLIRSFIESILNQKLTKLREELKKL